MRQTFRYLAVGLGLALSAASPGGAEEPQFPVPVNRTELRVTFRMDAPAEGMLRRNGFVVMDGVSRPGLRDAYPKDRGHEVPLLVTTDAMLALWYELYRSVLVETEQRRLYPDLAKCVASLHRTGNRLLRQTSDAQARTALRQAVVTLAVAERLLGGSSPVTPELRAEVDGLVARVLAARETRVFPGEDYTHYRVRGHYANSPSLSRYFRGSTWLSRQVMRVDSAPGGKPDEPLLTGVALASILEADTPARSGLARVTARRRFLAGKPNAIATEQLRTALQRSIGAGWTLARASQPDALARLRRELAKADYPEAHVWSRVVAPGQQFPRKVIALLPDAAVPDSRLFQRTMHPSIPGRTLPSTLEVGATLGWDVARHEIRGTDSRAEEVLAEVDRVKPTLADGEDTVYGGWLAALRTLSAPDPRAPEFMRGGAWQYKSLQTSLAGWAQLRHSSQLYATQPYGGMLGESVVVPVALVEPVPPFFRSLGTLAHRSNVVLGADDGLARGSRLHLAAFEAKCRELTTAADAQLAGRLTTAQSQSLAEFGGWLEQFPFVTEPVVVDVATGSTRQVLHAATGDFNPILAIPDAKTGIAYVGWVMSYYESRRPDFTRLTDVKWKKALSSRHLPPERPTWTAHFVAGSGSSLASDRLCLRQAEELFTRRRPVEALKLLRETAAAQPPSAVATEAQLRIGRHYLDAGNFQRAIVELRKCERLYGCAASDLARATLSEAEHSLRPGRKQYEAREAAAIAKARKLAAELRASRHQRPSRAKELALLRSLFAPESREFFIFASEQLTEAVSVCRTDIGPVLEYAMLAMRAGWASNGYADADVADACLAFSRRTTSPSLKAGAVAHAVMSGLRMDAPDQALDLLLPYRKPGAFQSDPTLKLLQSVGADSSTLTLDPSTLVERAFDSVLPWAIVRAFERGDWARLSTYRRLLPAESGHSTLEGLRRLFTQFSDEGSVPLRLFVEANGKEHRAGPLAAANAFHALSRAHPRSRIAPYALWCAADCLARAGQKSRSAAVRTELVNRHADSYPVALIRMQSALDAWKLQDTISLSAKWYDDPRRPRDAEEYLKLQDAASLANHAQQRLELLKTVAPLLTPDLHPRHLEKLLELEQPAAVEREVERLFPDTQPEVYLTLMKVGGLTRLANAFLRRFPDHPRAGEAWEMVYPDDLSRDLPWIVALVDRGPGYRWEARARKALAEMVGRSASDEQYREERLAWSREVCAQVRELSGVSSRAVYVADAALAGELFSALRPEAALELIGSVTPALPPTDPLILEWLAVKRRIEVEVAAKQLPEWSPARQPQ